ncbi:MAG: zf-TFIIB domain-containing protein [Candidatus Thermoplasmatota archaeon]|nr:zf-TFIIB domain-containing protein [Candidatus Thermoplasmatota archaeon]
MKCPKCGAELQQVYDNGFLISYYRCPCGAFWRTDGYDMSRQLLPFPRHAVQFVCQDLARRIKLVPDFYNSADAEAKVVMRDWFKRLYSLDWRMAKNLEAWVREKVGMMETFAFGDNDAPHRVGDAGCPRCEENYPVAHHCGGLVHAHYSTESFERLDLKCDKCGKVGRE